MTAVGVRVSRRASKGSQATCGAVIRYRPERIVIASAELIPEQEEDICGDGLAELESARKYTSQHKPHLRPQSSCNRPA